MRSYIALLLVLCFGFAPVAAQHTFDVKYPIYSSTSASYSGLLRITPTKILANGNNNSTKPVLITFDNDGMITRQLTLSFNIHSSPIYWFIPDSNMIFMLIAEYLREKPGYPWHLIRLDTNLNLKSDTRLDSTITGIGSEYNNVDIPSGIILKDSTLIISVGYLVGYGGANSKYQRVAYRFSQDGKVISTYKFERYNNYDEPLYQRSNGEIVWNYTYYDSLKQSHSGLKTSDTTLTFNPEPLLLNAPWFYLDSYDRKSFTPTSDGGFALLNLQGEWPVITTTKLLKFDSNFHKQWETTLPGIDARALHLIESKNGGFYIITQSITDTTLKYEFPASCFLDIALSRVDASGRHIFTAYYGSGYCIQQPMAVLQDDDGGVIISGIYNRTYAGFCETTCNERDSTWIFKVDTLGRPARTITGVTEGRGMLSMRLYPNPASGELIIESGQIGFYNSVEIVNIDGKIVHSLIFTDIINLSVNIDISSLSTGTYFCRLRSQTGSITRPFIVQR